MPSDVCRSVSSCMHTSWAVACEFTSYDNCGMAAKSLPVLCLCLHICAACATSACMGIKFSMLDVPQYERQAACRSNRPIAQMAVSVCQSEKGLIAFWGVGSSRGAHCCECNRILSYCASFEIGIESCIPLQGLDHVMFVAATGNRLLLRQYAIAFKRSGAQVPRTELAEIGPRIDFSIRRSRGAPNEILTQSMKQPKLDKKKVSHRCQVAIKL